MFCDLHFHTYYSNGGKGNPAEIMPLMAASNCIGFACADHDALDAIPIFQAGAEHYGLQFIPGIEMSTEDPDLGGLHILGYGFDPHNAQLTELSERCIEFQTQKYLTAVNGIIEEGHLTDRDELERYWLKDEPDKRLTIIHVYYWLYEKGIIQDIGTAKAKCFSFCKPIEDAWIPTPPERAISIIHEAGGLAVLAHPAYGDAEAAEDRIEAMVSLGIDGIEVYTKSNGGEEEIERVRKLAEATNLLITGGSDFHKKCSQVDKWPSTVPFKYFEDLQNALG